MSEVKSSYVVYLYVDYRKETGSRVLRTYFDRQKAIDFAESLSTNYVTVNKARREEKKGHESRKGLNGEDKVQSDDEEEVEQDDDGNDDGPEYISLIGSIFDAKLRCPVNHLTAYGLTKQEASFLWINRIAVDVAQHFD